MLRPGTARAAVTAALITSLLLGGCSEDETSAPAEPSTSAPSSAITTEESSPTPSDSEPPTSAPAGETAQQFIRRWVELANHMVATGETQPFLAVSGPDCTSCNEVAQRVTDIYERDGFIEGGDESVVDLEQETATQWVITRRAAPSRYTERADGAVQTYNGGRYKSRIYLGKVRGRWIVGATEGVPL